MNVDDANRDFTQLVDNHRRAVQRYVLRRLADPDDSDDVVSETFAIAWRKRDAFPPSDRELPWLYGIAFRVLSNHRRSRDRWIRLHGRIAREREDDSDTTDMSDFNNQELMKALCSLGKLDRELLRLAYWEKLKYRDIAIALQISENAVAIRASRAKKKLRARLESTSASPSSSSSSGEEVEA
ncbi:MAG: sigma-70 family RNA polymerase sigma factor [Acidimicrobiales bacterium]